MSGGINYSKWDKMDYGSDDESSGAEEEDTPKVTRLDAPSAVTFSSQGVNVEPSCQQISATNSMPMVNAKNPDGRTPPTNESEKQLARRKAMLIKNGSIYIDPETKNEVYWCQDRNEAILSVRYDHKFILSKDIRVHVKGSLNYEGRHAAVGVDSAIDGVEGSKGKVVISAVINSEPCIILQGYLGYPIYFSESELEVDWEIDVTDPNMKLIRVTLRKAVPMQGLTVWWSRPLLHFPEIDVVADIEGRNLTSNGNKSVPGEKTKHDKWKQSWEEAHKMFREKVKNIEKEVIDI